MLLIIPGCSNKNVVSSASGKDVTNYNYLFKGENESWTAEYKVNATVTFTKENDKLDGKSNSNNSSGNGAIVTKDKIINVNIDFDGNTQTIELKNVQ